LLHPTHYLHRHWILLWCTSGSTIHQTPTHQEEEIMTQEEKQRVTAFRFSVIGCIPLPEGIYGHMSKAVSTFPVNMPLCFLWVKPPSLSGSVQGFLSCGSLLQAGCSFENRFRPASSSSSVPFSSGFHTNMDSSGRIFRTGSCISKKFRRCLGSLPCSF